MNSSTAARLTTATLAASFATLALAVPAQAIIPPGDQPPSFSHPVSRVHDNGVVLSSPQQLTASTAVSPKYDGYPLSAPASPTYDSYPLSEALTPAQSSLAPYSSYPQHESVMPATRPAAPDTGTTSDGTPTWVTATEVALVVIALGAGAGAAGTAVGRRRKPHTKLA